MYKESNDFVPYLKIFFFVFFFLDERRLSVHSVLIGRDLISFDKPDW